MPIYLMECRTCEHQWDAFFNMKDKKEGSCPKCKEIGRRIYTVPNVAIDANPNAYDINALTEKSGKMKGNLGDLWDMAAEASAKRGGDNDPIKKQALKNYAKERNGKEYRKLGKKPKSISVELKPTSGS